MTNLKFRMTNLKFRMTNLKFRMTNLKFRMTWRSFVWNNNKQKAKVLGKAGNIDSNEEDC